MRYALSLLAGALVLGVAFLRLPGINSPLFSMVVVIVAALGTGFFAARRGALAGLLIVYLGNLIFVVSNIARYGFGGEDPSGVAGFVVRLLIVQFMLLQFAIPAAIAGWLGSFARRRLVQRWR